MLRFHTRESSNGMFLSVLYAFAFLSVLVLSSLAVDITHRVAVQDGLQHAVDAAALAGAQQLINNGSAQTAKSAAVSIATANTVDNIAITDNPPATAVAVSVNTTANPKTVTVTVQRTMINLFASLLNHPTSQVTASATASASQGLSTVNPNQVGTIAVSLDYVPSSGPEQNQALQTITAGQSFTIDLANNDNSGQGNCNQKEANGCLIRSIGSSDISTLSSSLSLGSTQVQYPGSNAGVAQWTSLINNGIIQVGDTLAMVLVTGTPPGSQQTQNLTVVGVCGLNITSLNSSKKLITGTIQDPITLSGQGGSAPSTGSTTTDTFISTNAPWQCVLTQ